MKRLTVIVSTLNEPSKSWALDNVTMRSLSRQAGNYFSIIPVWDQFRKGAAWARNEGFKAVESEFTLFSDDDIEWREGAIERMVSALDSHPWASYSYGAYLSNWRGPEIHTIGWQRFDAAVLREHNYISTMSVIRSADFPGFDESLRRHQDWDLWLTMLGMGRIGVFCEMVIFETRLTAGGITFGSIPIAESRQIIARKHGL